MSSWPDPVKKFIPPALFGVAVAAFPLPASAQERDKGTGGSGASSEGGASLGGTGIDSGISNPRGVDERDKRFKIQRKPKPAAAPPAEPADRKPPADKEKQ